MSDSVLSTLQGHVGVLTLNRPEKRNALTMAMREQLSVALGQFEDNPDVRVVVLLGSPPSFCAGVDLGESSTSSSRAAEPLPSVSAPFAAFAKPIFAAVNGAAAGGGFEIALACDFILASETATFSLPEVRIGSLPGGGGTQRLVRAVPRALATRMLYTGDAMDAASALASGLVTEVVDDRVLEEHALALATRIAANAPLSLAAIKQCLKAAVNNSLDDGLAIERKLFFELSTTDDRAEGRAAFRDRRPPEFRGK